MLRRDLAAAQAHLEATRAQLLLADPDGFLVAGSAAARAATAKAAAAAKLESQRRDARELQRAAALVGASAPALPNALPFRALAHATSQAPLRCASS